MKRELERDNEQIHIEFKSLNGSTQTSVLEVQAHQKVLHNECNQIGLCGSDCVRSRSVPSALVFLFFLASIEFTSCSLFIHTHTHAH